MYHRVQPEEMKTWYSEISLLDVCSKQGLVNFSVKERLNSEVAASHVNHSGRK